MTLRGWVRGPRGLLVGLLGLALLVTGLGPATAGPGGSPPSDTRPSFAPRDGEEPEFVPGELLVRYEPGTPSPARASVRRRGGIERIRNLPLPGLELVRARGPGTIPEQAARISAEPDVRYAEPNFIMRPLGAPLPNDPEFEELWGLHNEGLTGGTPGADIDAVQGWQIADASHGSEIVVGVIDTGIDINHPDLVDRIWTNPNPGTTGCIDDLHGCDFTTNPPTGDTVFNPLDGDDHGTHVAGTIAATMNNDTDVAGVSQAKIMPIKFIGPDGGTTDNAIRAIQYAIDNGAHITNNSWGGGGFSQALKNKIDDAREEGQLFVAAAGNDGDSRADFPARFTNENIVSVAATDHHDTLASFSNHGSTSVDLGAPGVSILSTVPGFGKAILAGPDTGDVELEHRSAFHTFGLEGIPDVSQREALLAAALEWVDVGTGDSILVVKDDRRNNNAFLSVYTETLAALGHTTGPGGNVSTHNTGGGGSGCGTPPTQATLNAAAAVIWFTGSTFSSTLCRDDREQLTEYLEDGAGRNLLLFGQDIGFDISRLSSGRRFLRDTLRAEYVADFDLNFRLSGQSETPYAGVGSVELDEGVPSSSAPGGQFFSSAFEPLADAVAGLRGGSTAWFNGTSMAAPHVTGAAAQIMAKFPDLEYWQVKERLLHTGDPLADLCGRTVSGRRLNLAGALADPLEGAPTELSGTAGERYQRNRRIDVSWAADDADSEECVNVSTRRARFNGGWGAWSPWIQTTKDSASLTGRVGRTYCFRVRTTNTAGETVEAPAACTAIPLNNTQLAHRRSWVQRSGIGGAYRGTLSRSTQKGARLVRKGIRAKHLAIVVTRCPKCGAIVVKWRGKNIGRIDLRAPTRQRREVIDIKSFPSVRKGKLVVVVRSRGKPVIVEGLGVSRV